MLKNIYKIYKPKSLESIFVSTTGSGSHSAVVNKATTETTINSTIILLPLFSQSPFGQK